MSGDPRREKRLAVRQPDHPLDYAMFEGVLPEGDYGAGPVIVWDTGSYRNLTKKDGKEVPVEEAVERGHVAFSLDGHKLHGGYALTRVPSWNGDDWLLVKKADAYADPTRDPVRDEPRSALSDRTLDEVARSEEASGHAG